MTESIDDGLVSASDQPFVAPRSVSRASGLFGAHSYHTKVPVEAIRPYVRHYTTPGAVVLDPFAGSGMTGIASALEGRQALLNDLSPAAVHIARNYTTPCDPLALRRAADRLLSWSLPQIEPLYAATCDSCGALARTEYTIWADLRACPKCKAEVNVWDSRDRAEGVGSLTCGSCGNQFQKTKAQVTGEVPVQVNLSCQSCRRSRIVRPPTRDDLALAHWAGDLPYWVPDVPFGPDRPMWRGGHRDLGITNVTDFWSRRNLFSLSVLWEGITREPDDRLRDALRFVFTAMLNRASRRYQWNSKRPTNVLSGTLYIASLRYEFNVLSLFTRKLRAALDLYGALRLPQGSVRVSEGSATDLSNVADASVDYCFTDPPFGANIYYADCSLLWESWLGRLTDRSLEAVVADRFGKSIGDYQAILGGSLAEVARCLRKDGWVTMIFQNTDEKVWSALREAAVDAGFGLVLASTLHKSQPSFKGIKASQNGERIAASDVVLTLAKSRQTAVTSFADADEVVTQAVRQELEAFTAGSDRLRSTAHLYAVTVSALVGRGYDTSGWTFERLDALLARHFERRLGRWYLKESRVVGVR